MTNVIFTREFNEAIWQIAYEMKRMNELKKIELELKYGDLNDE